MNKTRQWSVFTAIGALAILGLSWFVLISPQRSKAADLHTQAASVASSNEQKQAQLAQLQQQKANLPAQQQKLAKYNDEIPTGPALPDLIRDLSAAANDAGVTLVSIAPSEPAPMAATAVAGAAPALPTVGSLEQINVDLQVSGSYYNVISFFQSVESMKRKLRVNGLELSPDGGSTSGSGGSSSDSGATSPADTLTGTLHAAVFEQAPTVTAVTPVTPTSPAPAQ